MHSVRSSRLEGFLALVALAGALTALPAQAGSADRPVAVDFGYESWRLPGAERLGIAHAGVLFEFAPDWWAGPAAYGAATGQRGGFYLGALELQRPIALGAGLRLVPGFTIGGGGGAAAPVGNGLMLRPSLALQVPIGGAWRAGIGVSHVRFPGAPISSTQWGLVAQWQGSFGAEPLARIDSHQSAEGRSGLGFDQMAIVAGRYTLRANAPTPKVDLVGVRLDRYGDDRRLRWGVEAAAAANRASAGYMEILGHAGWEWPLYAGLNLGVRAALGFGGGGAVPTGGGTIGHLDATLRLALAPGWQLGASYGTLAGRSSSLRGRRAELSLIADLEPLAAPGTPGRVGVVRRVDWAGTVQQVRAVVRKDGSVRAIDTIGLQLNWWLNENAYLTGQAHSAAGGGAGAYSQGLLGAGVATPFRGRYLQLGAELLAGGGGGGGVESLAGPIVQGMVWGGFQPHHDGAHLRIGLGAEKSRHGSRSRVIAIGWVVPFGQTTR